MSTVTPSDAPGTRSIRSYLQIGIAAIGAAVILWGLAQFAFVFGTMPRSESGFAEGLAIVVFGLYVLVGFILLSLGLLFPQQEGDGIQFSQFQRRLLAYGAVAPIVGVVLVPIGATFAPPILEPLTSLFVVVVVALLVSGPLATLVAIGGKLRDRRS